MVFSIMLPAVFLDLMKHKPLLIKGASVGFLWSFLLFGFSSYFFDAPFQYTLAQASVAIVAGTMGGLLVGAIILLFRRGISR